MVKEEDDDDDDDSDAEDEAGAKVWPRLQRSELPKEDQTTREAWCEVLSPFGRTNSLPLTELWSARFVLTFRRM